MAEENPETAVVSGFSHRYLFRCALLACSTEKDIKVATNQQIVVYTFLSPTLFYCIVISGVGLSSPSIDVRIVLRAMAASYFS